MGREGIQSAQRSQERPEWMGLRDLREYASVSERTLRDWIRNPVDPLPASKVRGKVLVRRRDFDAYLERHRIEPVRVLGEAVEEIMADLGAAR